MPTCWWVVADYRDGSVDLCLASDSKAKAVREARHYRKASKEWLDRPTHVRVVRDSAKLHTRQRKTPLFLPWTITARWNWLDRNHALITRHVSPKWCRFLAPTESKAPSSDMLASRLGGPAVLPQGTEWPKFTVSSVELKGKTRRKVFGKYVGLYDLRGCFRLPGFPAAISIFIVATKGPGGEFEWARASPDPYYPIGKVIPIFKKSQVDVVAPPLPEWNSPAHSLHAWDMPDFPPYDTSLEESMGIIPRSEAQARSIHGIYAEIDKLEPGTSGWLHVRGNKIGGYEHYVQNSLPFHLSRKRRGIQWRLIATYTGEELAGGDGVLYILAGWDKKARQWRWHCEWQCS